MSIYSAPLSTRIAVGLACVLLAGCATAYGPAGFGGGYTDTRLGENIFRVSFRGNGYGETDRAADFAMLRSAELALENGFPFFAVVEASSDIEHSSYTTPLEAETHVVISGRGANKIRHGVTTIYGGETVVTATPSSTNLIMCFKDRRGDVSPLYDARYVSDSIRAKYSMTGP